VVDTHVIRLSQRLGWTPEKNPEKIEKDLMGLLDRKHWKDIPHLLKSHGRAVCRAPIPECSVCAVNRLCPKSGVEKHL
jgi:endonuclease-3